MKKLAIIIVIAFISITGISQINYQGVVKSKSNLIKVNENSYKYYTVNKKDNTLQLFNLDNSLWKSIELSIPEEEWFDEILYISTTEFNPDSNVEIVFTTYMETYSNFFGDVETIVYDNYTLFIVNELGEEILKVDGGRTFDLIKDNESGKVFLIDVYTDEEFFPDYKKTFVYSLY